MAAPIMQLKCYCNEYEWGKTGRNSLAARLCEKTPGTDFRIDDSKTYAEMWMGTYPDLPSYVLETGEDLQKVLDANQELIGNIKQKFGHTNIPYLPKVLSIAKALPLQVHPNKELSAKLHQGISTHWILRDSADIAYEPKIQEPTTSLHTNNDQQENPSDYTDPNHKPEIAIALSKFEAFCGWKPLDQIEALFSLDPLKRYNSSGSKIDNNQLKSLVSAILKDDSKQIEEVQRELAKLPDSAYGPKATYIKELLPRLQSQYGKQDPGNLVALLTMNYMVLEPGQSIYIPADGIHAYLAGDIIECMARSNNVINTGFCPRPDKDTIDMFVNTLTFDPHSPEEAILRSKPFSKAKNNATVYAPPLSEFSLYRVQFEGKGEEVIEPIQGPTILIVTNGSGTLEGKGKKVDLKEGYIFFVGAGVELQFSGIDLDLWAAYCE